VTRNPDTGAVVVRPFEADRLEFPTMRELREAELAAARSGDHRRALAYRIVRSRRLRRAQRGARA
jgi:hypothetical protein